MMMMNKKIIWVVVALLVIGAATWAIVRHSKPQAPAPDQTQEALNKEFDPQSPNFIIGNIKSVKSPEELEFTSGPNTYTAKLAGDSKIIKQVADKDGIHNVDAIVSDLKVGAQIVVYFLTPPQNNVYESYKIQILN
jgi:hypothetical protein